MRPAFRADYRQWEVCFDGDSLSAGTPAVVSSNTRYPQLCMPYLRHKPTYQNIAVGGTIGGHDGFYRNPSRTVYVLLTGVNGFNVGWTAAQVKASIQAAITDVRSKNVAKVVLSTVFASAETTGDEETERLALNVDMKANYVSWNADAVIDFAANQFLADASNWVDGVHPDLDGRIIQAQVAAPVINALIP